jgi:hypothetical protein
MARAAIWLIGLNLLDALATRQGLALGIMTEANPFLAWLLRHSPAAAWLFKLGVVPVLLLWLGATAHSAWTRLALRLLAAVYGLVIALHLTGFLTHLA